MENMLVKVSDAYISQWFENKLENHESLEKPFFNNMIYEKSYDEESEEHYVTSFIVRLGEGTWDYHLPGPLVPPYDEYTLPDDWNEVKERLNKINDEPTKEELQERIDKAVEKLGGDDGYIFLPRRNGKTMFADFIEETKQILEGDYDDAETTD